MNIAIVLLNQGRGSGEVARAHAAHLSSRGHKVWFVHPGVGAGVPGAINVDVELHTATVPVHEFLPAAKADQKAVSLMSYEEVRLDVDMKGDQMKQSVKVTVNVTVNTVV